MGRGRPPLPIGTWGTIATTALAKGKWRARARFRDYDGHTRLVQRVGRTKGAATSALTSYLVERTTPASADITGATYVEVVAGVWRTEMARRELAPATVRRYGEVLDLYVLPAVGGLTVREATVTRLDAFLKTVTDQTGAPTARLCRTVLSGVMGLAVRHGAAPANPLRDVAEVTVARPEPRALTFDEVETLRAAVLAWQEGRPIRPGAPARSARRGRHPSVDLLDIVDMLLGTGARIGEILALRWSDIDLDPEVASVTISATLGWEDQEAGPRQLVRQDAPKTVSSRRRLLLPRFVADMLLRRRVTMTAENPHDAVFPSAVGTWRDPGSVRKQWRKIRDEVGMGWVTPHTFRKTVATLLDRDEDLRAASAQLGHGGTAVTARHYVQATHQGPDARRVLEQLVPGISGD